MESAADYLHDLQAGAVVHVDEREIARIADDAPSPEDAAIASELSRILWGMLAALPPRNADVLVARFGLFGAEEMTLQEVGDHLDPPVTRERVRQMESRGLRMLRHPTRRVRLQDFALSAKASPIVEAAEQRKRANDDGMFFAPVHVSAPTREEALALLAKLDADTQAHRRGETLRCAGCGAFSINTSPPCRGGGHVFVDVYGSRVGP